MKKRVLLICLVIFLLTSLSYVISIEVITSKATVGGSPSPCSNECSSSGSKQCSGNGHQTCGNYDADNCLEWSFVTNCLANETCSNGQCTTQITCTNECSILNSIQCVNNTSYKVCGNYDQDFCLEFSSINSCQSNQICQNSQCASLSQNQTCISECIGGMRKCSGNSYQICKEVIQNNKIIKGCFKYSEVINCPLDKICVNGYCSSKTQVCQDNTPYNKCSQNKPKYCNNGILINNCQKCGCPLQIKCL